MSFGPVEPIPIGRKTIHAHVINKLPNIGGEFRGGSLFLQDLCPRIVRELFLRSLDSLLPAFLPLALVSFALKAALIVLFGSPLDLSQGPYQAFARVGLACRPTRCVCRCTPGSGRLQETRPVL